MENQNITSIWTVDKYKEYFKAIGPIEKVKNNKNIQYYNCASCFDIETTSFKVHLNGLEQKQAIMYLWALSIKGYVITGRTWHEFVELIDKIVEWYGTNDNRIFVIYVHNLSFEFQFLRKWFKWSSVFAIDKRKPVRCLTVGGIEFRCSYLLSGYSLEKLAGQLTKHTIEKLVGDLDYSKIRHTETFISNKEMEYMINDVLIPTYYIEELLDRVKYIHQIPMTKTGFVREYSRKYCFYGGTGKRNQDIYDKYRDMITKLILDEDIYVLLKQAFGGGFTHANAWYNDKIIKNVKSQDFTSSYPSVMLCEKFPMSPAIYKEPKNKKEFYDYLNNYCCLFEVEFTNIEPKLWHENYISQSHCRNIKNARINNGRIVSADSLTMTITEQDYKIINSFYKWKKQRISNFHIFYKGYLPKNFAISILDMYQIKTELKDVEGKEVEYMQAKENLNALYGMTVTDICREINEYNDEWETEKPNITEALEKNNKSRKRFLYYPWGVWVTAYARYNLFTAIKALGNDYIYSDTDSVKYINYEKHEEYFEWYNEQIIEKIQKAMKFHGIDFSRTCPENIKGEVKQIGIWEDEGVYSRFKTLGAKRYMTEKKGKISLTVSGLNKKKTVPYLLKNFGNKIFENFTNNLYIPVGCTGKMTHTYIDNEFGGYITDYLGKRTYYYEKSAIHLENTDYSLSLNELYVQYILKIREVKSI